MWDCRSYSIVINLAPLNLSSMSNQTQNEIRESIYILIPMFV